MKKSIIYLGIALAVFTSTKAASTLRSDNKQSATVVSETEQGDSLPAEAKVSGKINFAPVEDQTVLNPETALRIINQKAIEEVIAEDNKITESNMINDGSLLFIEKPIEDIIKDDNKVIENRATEFRPLYLERTLEDVIAENNAIIENDSAIEVQPLDFEVINKKQLDAKQTNMKLLIGMN